MAIENPDIDKNGQKRLKKKNKKKHKINSNKNKHLD